MYHKYSTNSCMIIKVKDRYDQLVLKWGITLEFWVLLFLLSGVVCVALKTKKQTPQGIAIE